MHTRKKGKSASKKPFRTSTPDWVNYSIDEVRDIIIELYKKGKSPSMIGTVLRDNYGIPSVKNLANKKITRILEENNIKYDTPEDMQNLIKKAVKLRKHLDNNKKDLHNKRGLLLVESKIRRLGKYYRSSGKLPAKWKYEPEKAKLQI